MSLLGVILPAIAASNTAPDVTGTVECSTPQELAFARYIARLEQNRPWTTETVEIEASLPRQEKHARLHAIRRWLPLGKPEFQVLDTDGDKTVRQQVIARYLTAEIQAADMPASTVAVSPANYKFRYAGFDRAGETVSYVFEITPRKKRQGLIRGAIWIEGQTGLAVRLSGTLVKMPSIFLKRIDVTKVTSLQGGAADSRVTHLAFDTRIAGRAELTIQERPVPDAGEVETGGLGMIDIPLCLTSAPNSVPCRTPSPIRFGSR